MNDMVNYYYNRMKSLNNEKIKLVQEKEKYINFKNVVSSINDSLSFVPSDLQKIEDLFLDGAYISDGQTLDEGTIKKDIENTDFAISKIEEIITKVKEKIIELDQAIVSVEKSYAIAKQQYINALNNNKGMVK